MQENTKIREQELLENAWADAFEAIRYRDSKKLTMCAFRIRHWEKKINIQE